MFPFDDVIVIADLSDEISWNVAGLRILVFNDPIFSMSGNIL